MKGVFVPAAIALWLGGAAGLASLGWDASLPAWRVAAAAAAGAGVLTGILVALIKSRSDANVAALAATLAIAVLLPARVAGTEAAAAFVIFAAAAILTGYYILQLRVRTHVDSGPLLLHGSLRIGGTVLTAALVSALAVLAVRAASRAVSDRWRVSVDATSGHLVAIAAILLLAILTALSLAVLSRTYAHVDQDEDERDSTRDDENTPNPS